MAIRAEAPMARGSLVCSQSHHKLLGFSNNNHHHHTLPSLHPPRPSHDSSTRSRPNTTVFIHFGPIAPGPSPRRQHLDLLPVTPRAADSTSTVSSSADKTLIPDDQFSLGKVSFGVIGLSVGISLLGYGFGAYFNVRL